MVEVQLNGVSMFKNNGSYGKMNETMEFLDKNRYGYSVRFGSDNLVVLDIRTVCEKDIKDYLVKNWYGYDRIISDIKLFMNKVPIGKEEAKKLIIEGIDETHDGLM